MTIFVESILISLSEVRQKLLVSNSLVILMNFHHTVVVNTHAVNDTHIADVSIASWVMGMDNIHTHQGHNIVAVLQLLPFSATFSFSRNFPQLINIFRNFLEISQLSATLYIR